MSGYTCDVLSALQPPSRLVKRLVFAFTARGSKIGFSLIEAVICIAITSLLFLAIISSLTFCLRSQSLQEQRLAAVAAAERELESMRSSLFQNLTPLTKPVLIDNNRTATTADDLMGTLSLSFRRMDGTLLAAGEKPATIDRLIAEVTVTWFPKGSLSSQEMHETLMKNIVP